MTFETRIKLARIGRTQKINRFIKYENDPKIKEILDKEEKNLKKEKLEKLKAESKEIEKLEEEVKEDKKTYEKGSNKKNKGKK